MVRRGHPAGLATEAPGFYFIYLKARYESTTRYFKKSRNQQRGFTKTDKPDEWIAACYGFLGDEPAQLVGGWIYLHDKSNTVSKFGGLVTGYVPCHREDKKIKKGASYIFIRKDEAKNIKWRNSPNTNIQHGHSNFLDADLPHEKQVTS